MKVEAWVYVREPVSRVRTGAGRLFLSCIVSLGTRGERVEAGEEENCLVRDFFAARIVSLVLNMVNTP